MKTGTGSTGRTLSSTCRTWPKMTRTEVVPVELEFYRYNHPKIAQNGYFLPFFTHFSPWITPTLPTHLKIIPNSPWNLFSTQFLFHFLSSFKTFPLISPNIILIWVTTHIHTKYQDLLGFDQNPNSISFHLTMNPTTKEGFHNYLVPCGLYQP